MRIEIVGDDVRLRARTQRAVDRLSLATTSLPNGMTWFLRAGAWDLRSPDLTASATGKPLVAFGATRGDARWTDLLRTSGGVLEAPSPRPPVASVVVEGAPKLRSLDEVWDLAAQGGRRVVRVERLDVSWDERVRACIAVTTLHRGGAERIAIDLAAALEREGAAVRFVVARATPQWPTHAAPPNALNLPRGLRAAGLLDMARDFGSDVLHTHLFPGDEVATLARGDVPVVVTVHNDQSRWSDGFDAVTNTDVAVSLGCSWRVAQGLRGRVRVAPNFTSPGPSRAPARTEAPLTILCVANVRRQKRIELAVETLASLRARGHDARLILAGGVVPGEEEAADTLRATIEQRGVGDFIQSLGSREDTRSLHSEADVLLTTSLYEGMSVAQLEALSAPIPVVSTDVGGARELAATHGHYHVAEASADALADAVERAVARPSSGGLSAHFTPEAAARRHVRAYRGAATHRSRSSGLVLVINNLATGGAQASARRLLLALAERGHDVAAAVLQEQSAYPSRWRAELESAMPVFVAPRAGTCPADVTAAAVVDFVRRRRAGSVVFWNVMPLYKLLMADELVGCALHDVSPGEMYFTELDRYFAAPRADLPYFEPSDYGSLLDGVIVKYAAEEERARRGLGAPVTVIPNGVDVTAAPQRHRNGVFVIGTLARIAPDKKLEQLLDAMRVLPQGCELRVAGRVARTDGDYARALAESARDLPVTFVGDVEAQAFLGDLDAFAMVSEPAGCPNALLEAMAAGLPVAATDAGGARDIVGTAGILTPRGDGRGLGEALTRLFVDESLRRAAGVAARERIAERFSLDRMVASYEAVLFTSAS